MFYKDLTDWLSETILSPYAIKPMMKTFAERNLASPPLPKNLEAWEKERERLRQAIIRQVGLEELLGPVELKLQSRGVIERQGYTVEKIIYESYPGMTIPALVYAPNDLRDRSPGIVSIGGHNHVRGKAEQHVQARAANLSLRGCVVITYDYMNCFERNTRENNHFMTSFSFSCRTPTALEILDGVRAIDYLIGRDDVDPERIGFTGESGGGNSTYWVSAIDERVSLAVPVSSVTTFDHWIRENVNWDWHQRPHGIMKYSDLGTLLALIAPRPLLIISSRRGTDDAEFPFEEAERSYQKARKIYKLYGAEERVAHVESSTCHGYQRDKREHLYEWVGKWFFNDPSWWDSSELPFRNEPLADLTCGLLENNLTYRRIFKEWSRYLPKIPSLPKDAETAEQYQRMLRGELRGLLGLPRMNFRGKMTVCHKKKSEGAEASFVVFETEERMLVTGVMIVPQKEEKGRLAVCSGRKNAHRSLIKGLLSSGYRVLLLDARDFGEPYSLPRNWAWFVGRPPLGTWVYDIVAIVKTFIAEESAEDILILGFGEYGRGALFAGAIEPKIGGVVYSTRYLSYREELNCFPLDGKGSVCGLPGVLSYGDMAQFAALVAPRRCFVLEVGHHSSEEIGSYYQWTLDFYRIFRSDRFRLGSGDQNPWDEVADWLAS